MKLYSENENYKLYQGNMLNMLEVIKPNSIDSIVTDPPYELNFMGKGWDNAGISFDVNTWKKCYEVLKEGGYLLAFGGSRTYHRIACAIEDAGFEVRDTIMWLYGSGFPKSMNIGKKLDKWQGWGTCLKPSFEPIIVARKPFKGSLVDNVIKNGVGGINIDECRVETSKEDLDKLNKEWDREWNTSYKTYAETIGGTAGFDYSNARVENKGLTGRFPANTILTYDETDYDEVCGGFPTGKKNGSITKRYKMNNQVYGEYGYCKTWTAYNDSGSASRYFYCAKASKKDRDEGLDVFNEETVSDGRLKSIDNPFQRGETPRKNIHPTVKPTELMQYLVRLVTPNGGVVLDPFNGSGSTGKAVMYENKERNKNYKYIGIELTEEYLPISKARIDYVI